MIFIGQHDRMDCGPACLAMVANWYGKNYTLQYLRENSFINREGVSLLGISEAAKKIGFDTVSMRLSNQDLSNQILPCIIHWNQNHFVVLKEIKRTLVRKKVVYKIVDPAHGILSLKEPDFNKGWASKAENGIALLLNPTNKFYSNDLPVVEKITIRLIYNYLKPFKKQLGLMFILLLAGSIISFVIPFLTKGLVDNGVVKKDIPLISLILMSQLGLFTGSLFIGVVRNWLMLYVGSKINIKIISEYFKKLLKLPVRFFDSKMMGDFNQRILDHERIESFLSSQSLLTFFSLLTFTAFLVVFSIYSLNILLIYLVLTFISVAWSFYFLKQRRILDYHRFQQKSENQEAVYEIINGVTELKLNQLENYKRNNWELIQKKLYQVNIKILKLDQFQVSGFDFINQVKNIVVTYLAATYVISGKMSLGELMSVSFIVGQMNGPITQLVNFFRGFQDAKLSLERLSEVKGLDDEDNDSKHTLEDYSILQLSGHQSGIHLVNLNFQYGPTKSPFVLQNLSAFIPEGKTTAIVGSSGSGKTTLLKLLLKFYDPTQGEILINDRDILSLSPIDLRKNCGVVMQDGYVFSDTIEKNIVTSDEVPNEKRFLEAIQTANIQEFIESLPLGKDTKIGAAGNGISGGQKQRILIARAVYKNPKYVFLDEATSALDSENEKVIYDNLNIFLKGRTVLIIAHRLSTVKDADQIIVLKKGILTEIGNHNDLVQKRGDYFNLVKNQLDLGN